jgi:hypothetical protein
MYVYKKFGKFFAAYIEISKDLGAAPAFGIKACNGETLIDIPYGQIILTPRSVLRCEQGFKENERPKYKCISEVTARVAKNRP